MPNEIIVVPSLDSARLPTSLEDSVNFSRKKIRLLITVYRESDWLKEDFGLCFEAARRICIDFKFVFHPIACWM